VANVGTNGTQEGAKNRTGAPGSFKEEWDRGMTEAFGTPARKGKANWTTAEKKPSESWVVREGRQKEVLLRRRLKRREGNENEKGI